MNLGNIRLRFRKESQPGPKNENALTLLEKARKELEAAQDYFNNVSSPDLVDHAVYVIEAAQRKFEYLIRKAKTEKVTNSTFYVN